MEVTGEEIFQFNYNLYYFLFILLKSLNGIS